MSATEILKHEHEVILLALEGAEAQAHRLTTDFQQTAAVIELMTDFFANFADRCHHAKEEKLLFPRLEELGMPREGGPLGVMLAEHEQGRAYIRAIREDLPRAANRDHEAMSRIRVNLGAYVDLLREHIDKEDHCLFAMAEEALSPEDQAELVAAFERAEAEEMGEGVHERYHRLAHWLAETAQMEHIHGGGCSSCGGCKS